MTPRERATSDRRLRKLADFLDKLPRKRFNYLVWVGEDWKGAPDLSCGTTACAVGWATTIPAFRRLGLRLTAGLGSHGAGGGYAYNVNDATSHEDAVKSVFLLTHAEARYLFLPNECSLFSGGPPSPGEDATPKKVAAHIRRFVKDRAQYEAGATW